MRALTRRRDYRTHDAWGNVLSTTGSMAGTLGANNPLRYRGYVYDRETGLYYLQSRYYDPEMGRFMNADSLVSTGQGLLGNNMFAYCRNNPVRRIDISGAADADCVNEDGEIFSSDELECRTGGGGSSSSTSPHGSGVSSSASGGGVSPQSTNKASDPKNGKPYSPDQQSVIELAKESKSTGLSREEGEYLVNLAEEYRFKSHPPMTHSDRSGIWSYTLHISVRGIHIIIFE